MAIFAFVAGVWLCQQQASLPGVLVMFLLAGTLTVAALVAFRRAAARSWPWLLAVVMLAATAGFEWAALRAHLRLADELPLALEGQPVEITGIVADLPVETAGGSRFAFAVEQAAGPVPGRILLGWSGRPEEAAAGAATVGAVRVRPGERWHFTVKLQRPHGAANPHGTDYEATLLERGLRATGRVLVGRPAERLDAFVPGPMVLVHRLRDRIRARFRAALPGREYAGVLIALAVGDQQAIDPAQWEVFRRTGVAHLVSISGLHVSMVGLLAGLLAGWRWRHAPRRVLRWPALKVAAAAGLVAAASYAALAGLAIPTQRALIMLAVIALALLSGREAGGMRVLALALLCVVVADPWAVLSAGFWLSFGAVAAIMHVLGGRVRRPGTWHTALLTQLGITLATMPALLGLFGAFSIVSPIANAFAIPLVSFAITPLTLSAIVFPADPLLKLAHALTALMMGGLEWLAALPKAMWVQAAAPAGLVVAATLGVAWLMLPRGTPARHAGLMAMLPLLGWSTPRPAEGGFRLVALDVGQGTAVHVQTAQHDLIYDAGPAWGEHTDAGARVVVPYLRANGLRRIDRAIVSHDDLDHSGGMPSVLAAFDVAELTAGAAPARRWEGLHSATVRPCEAGNRWEWDGVEFAMVHPAVEQGAAEGDNNSSCVLRIAAPGGRALLTGDIERPAERRLLAGPREAVAAEVVVAPHHGSRSSSGEAFVSATGARTVVFTAGYRNQFRHPHPDVVARWTAAGAEAWRTDLQGAILVDVGPRGLVVSAQRAVRPRYWHGR